MTIMDDATMQKEWNNFSKSIDGKVHPTNSNYFDHDNHYKISAGENEIELDWGNQPQKGRGSYVTLESTFKYKLKNSESIKLKIYPKDISSRLLSLFIAGKRKTGIRELDNTYIFITNSENLILELTEEFKVFHKINKYKNFVFEIETITDIPTLRIYIPELITDQRILDFYYNFGLRLKKIIQSG